MPAREQYQGTWRTFVLLYLALTSSLALIASSAFYWDLVDWFWFVVPFILLPLWGAFLGVTVLSAVHVCSKGRFRRFTAYLPLAVQAVAIVTVWTVPLPEVKRDLDFRWRLEQREEVVRLVLSGELAPAAHGRRQVVRLPRKYRHLSKGGTIEVQRTYETTSIIFFTFLGVPDSWAGFVYRSDDKAPELGPFGSMFIERKRLRTNWYWVIST
jgi:hypothetical protein